MWKSFLVFALFITFTPACSDDGGGSDPTSVQVTYPEQGQVLVKNRIKVTGTASGSDTVDVNGVVADVLNGEWEALVAFEQGEVVVTAINGASQDEVEFVVDSLAPKLMITSPERGEYVDQQMLTVLGRVEEGGTGLSYVEYGGQKLDVDQDGNFSTTVLMKPGLNVIKVTAQDLAGNEARALRGVMFGDVTDPTQTIDPAFTVFVRKQALDVVEEVIENMATPEFVTSLATDSLMFDSVALDAIRFDPIDVEIEPLGNNLINLSLYVTNAELEGSFTVGTGVYPTTVNVAKFDIQLEVRIFAADDGGIDFEFGEAQLNLLEEDLTFTIQDLTQDDAQFLRNLVVDVASQTFGSLLSKALFEQLFDPDILKRKIEILGRTLVFELAFKDIQVYRDGILVQLSVTMPTEKFPDVRDVPGALNLPRGNPGETETKNDIIFTTTQNAMDRILHGVWRSGLLHQELNGEDFGSIKLPFELTSSALALVLDKRIGSLAGDVPAVIGLRPLLPPVLDLQDKGTLQIQLAETAIDIKLAPPGAPEILVTTIAVFLTLEVDLKVDGLAIKLNFDAEAMADLAAEPEFDLDDAKAEGLFEGLVALIPGVIADGLEITGEADFTWLSLESPEIEVHGVDSDHVSVSLSMVPIPPE